MTCQSKSGWLMEGQGLTSSDPGHDKPDYWCTCHSDSKRVTLFGMKEGLHHKICCCCGWCHQLLPLVDFLCFMACCIVMVPSKGHWVSFLIDQKEFVTYIALYVLLATERGMERQLPRHTLGRGGASRWFFLSIYLDNLWWFQQFKHYLYTFNKFFCPHPPIMSCKRLPSFTWETANTIISISVNQGTKFVLPFSFSLK